MRPKVDFFRTFFRLLFEWLFTVLLAYFFLIIFVKTEPYEYIELLLFIFYTISYVSRRRAPNNLIIFLAHVIPAVVLYFMPVPKSTVWVTIAIDLYLLTEAFFYSRTGRFSVLNDTPWPSFLISVVIYAYGYFTKSSFLTTRAYIIPILLIMTYFMIIYMDGIRKYVDATKDVSGLPMKRIVKTNSIIVLLIMLILLFGLFLGDFLGLDNALYKLVQGILYGIFLILLVVRTIIRILLFLAGGGVSAGRTLNTADIEEQAVEYSQGVGGTFEFILKLALAGLAIYLFYKMMVWFIRLLMKRRNTTFDIIEKADVRHTGTEKYNIIRKNTFGTSKEETLRRLYRENIWRYRYDIKLNDRKTAQEISDELYDKQIADVDEITKIYRDVRYGGEKVTKNMLRAFKK
ncbi:MAG: hypothetical protein IJ763_01315 [Lachnospiraceae bacterium]|nr:hypothetical protein [Lachnospiraceae bacterium]